MNANRSKNAQERNDLGISFTFKVLKTSWIFEPLRVRILNGCQANSEYQRKNMQK